jgi:RND family efflux transporter MFP subunit
MPVTGNKQRHIIMCLALVMAGCCLPDIAAVTWAGEARPVQEGTPVLTVEPVQPVRFSLPVRISANGSIAPWQEAVISAELGGVQLLEILAQVGDQVKKGQVLAVFDRERVAADVENSRAVLAEAEAMLEESRENARRVRDIIDEGAMSALQAGQYLTAEKTAEARVRAARAHLDIQNLRMKHTRVVANDDGIITRRQAVLGVVTQEGQELFRLIRQNRLEWHAEVTASELFRLRAGSRVEYTVPDVGSSTGQVRMVGPGLDPGSRYGTVYVDLPGAMEQGFRPGMYAQGYFLLGSSEGLMLPRSAITLRDGFSYVFRLSETGKGMARLEEVKIRLGRSEGELVEVLEGIQADDRVVRSGGAFLSGGDQVRLLP